MAFTTGGNIETISDVPQSESVEELLSSPSKRAKWLAERDEKEGEIQKNRAAHQQEIMRSTEVFCVVEERCDCHVPPSWSVEDGPPLPEVPYEFSKEFMLEFGKQIEEAGQSLLFAKKRMHGFSTEMNHLLRT